MGRLRVVGGSISALVLLHDLLDCLVIEVTALGLLAHGLYSGARLDEAGRCCVPRLGHTVALLVQCQSLDNLIHDAATTGSCCSCRCLL